VEKKKPEPKS
jgi:hypothetical protein